MGHASAQYFWPCLLGSWGGTKRSDIIKFSLQSQFQRFFKPNVVCLHTNKRYKVGFSFGRLGYDQGWDLRVLGDLFFKNMVTWNIKLKGMMSRTAYK